MKLKFPLVAAFAAVLSLTACGGGGGDGGSSSTPPVVVANPAAFAITDTVVGTGVEAKAGTRAVVTYTGWLYSATAADHKGTKFDSGSFDFSVAAGSVIKGFDQGVLGMKVGGKRTVLIPSSLGYGTAGSGAVPPNAGLVFDIELTGTK